MSPARAARSLAGLPTRLLFNPILARELRVAGRRKSTYITRTAFALLMAIGLVFIVLVTDQDFGFAGNSVVGRAQQLTRTVQILSYGSLWTGYVLLALLGPALTAGAICDERRARTLDTLASTPITPLQIVAGKIMARMQEAVVLALIAAPALLALRVFGGVPAEAIVVFLVLALCTTYLGAALAIWFSTWHRSSAGPVVYAFLMLGLLTVTPVIFATLGPQNGYFGLPRLGIPEQSLSYAFGSLYLFCPPVLLIAQMMDISPPGGFTGALGWFALHPWVLTAAWLLCAGTAVVLIASRALRKQMLKASSDAPSQPKSGTRESKRLSKLRVSPVYWRESSAKVFPKKWQLIVVSGVLVGFVSWAYASAGMDEEALHIIFGFAGITLLALLATVSTTGAVSAEREAQTWDVLLTTPLSGKHILAGKLLAGLRRLAIPFGLLMLHFVAASALGYMHPQDTAFLAIIIVPVVLFYLATGLLFSMYFRKIITAVVCNIILLISLWLGLLVLMVILTELVFDYGSVSEAIGIAAFTSNPIAMAMSAIEHSISQYDRDQYHIADTRVGTPGYTLALAAQAGMHLGGASIAFALACRRFKSRGGRSS